MKDILKFRFPQEAIASHSGILTHFRPEERKTGFIFSDFTRENCFLFEAEQITEIHPLQFSKEKPVVVSKATYLDSANTFIKGIQDLALGKAVLSRIKSEPFESHKTEALFLLLCEQYPDALVYLLSSEKVGTWIGASPEVLLETDEKYLYTMALAGTKKDESIEWTGKEVIEQELVTDFIIDELKILQVDDIESIGPFDFHAGPVIHLRTDISANLGTHSTWEIAKQLHPTPAVSGMPRKEALDLISKHESHERSLYTGMLGYISDEFARIFVNLRCAQIREDEIFLYLGGGFTRQSVPENEWQETENKSRTLLNVIAQL